MLGDKLWTPHATFHTVRQISDWASEEGLTMLQWKRFYHSYANVMSFKKAGSAEPSLTRELTLRCLNCGHSPLVKTEEGYQCNQCETSYDRMDGIHRFLV